jgi:hypothetical protein
VGRWGLLADRSPTFGWAHPPWCVTGRRVIEGGAGELAGSAMKADCGCVPGAGSPDARFPRRPPRVLAYLEAAERQLVAAYRQRTDAGAWRNPSNTTR